MDISAVEIADRTVTTFDGLAAGLNSRQLNQKNNIHVSFLGADGPTVLRFEMLAGVTVHPRRDTAPSKTRDWLCQPGVAPPFSSDLAPAGGCWGRVVLF